MMNKNLVGAKIGDKVVVVTSFGVQVTEEIRTITGVTKGGNFNIGKQIYYPSGRIRGDYGFLSPWAYIATSEDIKRIKEKTIIRKVIEQIRAIRTLKYSQAVKIAEILEIKIEPIMEDK